MQGSEILYLIFFIIVLLIFIRFIIYPLLYLLAVLAVYLIPLGLRSPSLLVYYNAAKLNLGLYKQKNYKEKLSLLAILLNELPQTTGYLTNDGVVLIGKIEIEQVEQALLNLQPNIESRKLKTLDFLTAHLTLIIQIALFLFILFSGRLTSSTYFLTAVLSTGLGYGGSWLLKGLFLAKSIEKLTLGEIRPLTLPRSFQMLKMVPFQYNIIKIDVR